MDTIGGIHLLVRSRSDGNPAARRVRRDVLGSKAFDRLRASLGEGFDQLCEEKITVVAGDLTQERLGLDAESYAALTWRIDLVVNSAATVTFDERLDLAVELNTMGPQRLLRFAKDCGDVPFLHVSTCYVAGDRTGRIVEDFSAPPRAEATLPRLPSGAFDLDGLVARLRRETEAIRTKLGPDTEECRQQLIAAGMSAARAHGWNDTYTLTKWIGEQLLRRDHGDVPLVIFRPAIIEGSYEEPAPGWIDGLRMADPIIVAYGRGKLNEFPANGEVPIDLIPADFVVNGILATLPAGKVRGGGDGGSMTRAAPRVYQCCTSDRNPLMLKDLLTAMVDAFRIRPMNDDRGRPIRPGPLRIVRREAFMRKWTSRARRVATIRALLTRLNPDSRRARKLSGAARQIEQLIYFSKIYSPYTHMDCRFASDELHAVMHGLHPDDAPEFGVDVGSIDWRDYIVNRHVPGIRSFVLGTGFEPSPRIRGMGHEAAAFPPGGESLKGENLFDVFRRTVERWPDKPALQIRRNTRWTRYTYQEAYEATGTVMKRLLERGLRPGERIAICGDSGPEWGLTYLAGIRTGLTIIPLDPQLPPAEAWSAAKFAGASLMCATPTTFDGLEKKRGPGDPELVVMRAPFMPPPGASLDPAPPPEPVDASQLASILFTSGTTVAPKAVQLTHRNFIANASALLQVHPVYPTDEFLSVLPMYHAFEFTAGFFVPLACGATITYLDQLKGPEIVSAMKATGTTVMLVVPRLLAMLADGIHAKIAAAGVTTRAVFKLLRFGSRITGDRYARLLFSRIHREFGGRLRMLFSGASRLDADVLRSFRRLGFLVCEGYGMTETAPVLTVNPPTQIKPESVGKPLPNVELEVRGANLEGIGEVWVRSDSVMRGYLKNSEATRDILVDGWLRTGDLGRLDTAGYLFLTGRSKDLIITSAGKNVYPDEVEFAYRDLPHVKELCVLAMPSADGLGDAVHAVAVIDPKSSPELDRSSIEREIRSAAAAIAQALPTHQRIAAFHFWTRELPKTTTLKAKRSLIKHMLLTESAAATRGAAAPAAVDPATVVIAAAAPVSGPAADAIRRILSRHAGKPAEAVRPEMNLLLDLGIDSIGKIEVIGQIEAEFNMRIDNDKAANVGRVADLLHMVADRRPVATPKHDPAIWRRRIVSADNAQPSNGRVPPPLAPLRWAIRGTVGLLMNSYIRVQAVGREHVPAAGPFILAPNHSSHLDAPAILTALGSGRRVWIAGAEDYFFNTALKRLVFGKCLDTIAFDRKADGLEGLRRCGEALARGDGLLLFPEGTRSVSGVMQPFKIGVAVLATERNVPIIPVRIQRAYELLPKGQRFARPGLITVTFGRSVSPPDAEHIEDHYAAYRDLTEQVQAAVAGLARKG